MSSSTEEMLVWSIWKQLFSNITKQLLLKHTLYHFSTLYKHPGNKRRGIPIIFPSNSTGMKTNTYWIWRKTSIVLIKGGGGNSKHLLFLQEHVPRRINSFFWREGIWGEGELWSEKTALLSERKGRREIRPLSDWWGVWGGGEGGGGMGSPKHLYCSCKQHPDSRLKENSLKVFTLEWRYEE